MKYLKISDFCITPNPIPQEIADKILAFHIIPLCHVQCNYNHDIMVSEKSGYRPFTYEKSKGRAGTSEHCFQGKGAVDITSDGNLETLLSDLFTLTDYTRICYYPDKGFIHCDYKDKKRSYWEADKNGKWVWVKYLK